MFSNLDLGFYILNLNTTSLQRVTLEDGRQTRKLEYNYKKESKGRGVCNCATSTKRKLEHCDADDKQSDTIIAWSLPHTADRLFEFSNTGSTTLEAHQWWDRL